MHVHMHGIRCLCHTVKTFAISELTKVLSNSTIDLAFSENG